MMISNIANLEETSNCFEIAQPTSLSTVVGIWIEQYPIIFIYLSIFCCLFTTFIYVYVRHLFKKWQ